MIDLINKKFVNEKKGRDDQAHAIWYEFWIREQIQESEKTESLKSTKVFLFDQMPYPLFKLLKHL